MRGSVVLSFVIVLVALSAGGSGSALAADDITDDGQSISSLSGENQFTSQSVRASGQQPLLETYEDDDDEDPEENDDNGSKQDDRGRDDEGDDRSDKGEDKAEDESEDDNRGDDRERDDEDSEEEDDEGDNRSDRGEDKREDEGSEDDDERRDSNEGRDNEDQDGDNGRDKNREQRDGDDGSSDDASRDRDGGGGEEDDEDEGRQDTDDDKEDEASNQTETETQEDDRDEDRDGNDPTTTTRTATSTQTASPTSTSTPTHTPTRTATGVRTTTTRITSSPTASPTATAAPARLDISLATLSNTSITAGGNITVALRVRNTGGRVGSFLAALIVDGTAVATERITVAPGETETALFERQFQDPGTYEIAVDETSLGTVTVIVPSEAKAVTNQANRDSADGGPIEVVAATVPADWVKQGREARVRVTVENTGLQPAERLLTVTIDGEPVVTASVRLQPTERDTVTVGFGAIGGTVAVEGVEAGRINVSETRGMRDTTPNASQRGAGLTPGIGMTVAVVVVGTIAALVRHEIRG